MKHKVCFLGRNQIVVLRNLSTVLSAKQLVNKIIPSKNHWLNRGVFQQLLTLIQDIHM